MGQGSDQVLRELLGLQAKIYRLFDEQSARVLAEPDTVPPWAPPVDMVETADAFVLLAEIPGVDPDAIALEIAGGRLAVRGERTLPPDDPEASYHRAERPHGPFERVFSLPVEVDEAAVRASYRDGVLRVTLAKRAGHRTVPVEG